ncbi:MAG: hypothetical protein II308_04480, partial [Muribaculaceae bacterium]|nr:hypothetical protein [Muribaculaceae bacterium]
RPAGGALVLAYNGMETGQLSPDGFGNHYCFDTSRPTCNGKSCEIVFWQHDLEYDEKHVPEITHICFLDFIQEIMINDTLKYYDYDGNEK